jgi:hypothetical protein
VYGSDADVPPPGAGVVTVKFRFPGSVKLEAGIFTVSFVEPERVAAMLVPFIATVEFGIKPVPFSVTVAAVLIGPTFGEIEVRVGGGGFTIGTVTTADVPPPGAAFTAVSERLPKLATSAAVSVATNCVVLA